MAALGARRQVNRFVSLVARVQEPFAETETKGIDERLMEGDLAGRKRRVILFEDGG